MRFKEMVEGKEYKAEFYGHKYKVKDGLLYIIIYKDNGGFSRLSAKTINEMIFTEIPWKPVGGEKYYFVDIVSSFGYSNCLCCSNRFDKRIISRGVVYKTEKEVIQAVKDLGWEV